jgi:hypothetical protein
VLNRLRNAYFGHSIPEADFYKLNFRAIGNLQDIAVFDCGQPVAGTDNRMHE